MATSSTYTITVTAHDLFSAVLEELGILGPGASAKAADITTVKQRANFWLIQQNGRPNAIRPGEMMWTRESAELTLSTSSASYDLKPSDGDLDIQIPSAIHSVLYRDDDDNDTTLKWMSWDRYQAIYDKDGTGTPQKYHYQRRDDTGKLYLDVVPDTANSLIINYQQPLEIISATANNFDIDPSWYLALLYNVAYHCTGPFGIDYNRTIEIKSKAVEAIKAVSDISPDDQDFCMRPGR
jgi:hypothetical protein